MHLRIVATRECAPFCIHNSRCIHTKSAQSHCKTGTSLSAQHVLAKFSIVARRASRPRSPLITRPAISHVSGGRLVAGSANRRRSALAGGCRISPISFGIRRSRIEHNNGGHLRLRLRGRGRGLRNLGDALEPKIRLLSGILGLRLPIRPGRWTRCHRPLWLRFVAFIRMATHRVARCRRDGGNYHDR